MSASQILGNFGEFFGALLLVGSLIYVGAQIKQNTAATRAQVYQTRTGQAQDQFLFQISEPDFVGLMNLRSQSDFESEIARMSDLERQRYILFQTNVLNRMDNLFFQHQNGFLDKEYYEDVVELICRNNAAIWKHLEIPMRRSFRTELGRIEAEHQAVDTLS
jgi:hypothetical protein